MNYSTRNNYQFYVVLITVLFFSVSFKKGTSADNINDNHMNLLFYDYVPEPLQISSISSPGRNSLDIEEDEPERTSRGRYPWFNTDATGREKPDNKVYKDIIPGNIENVSDGFGKAILSSTKLSFEPAPAGFYGAPDQMIAVGARYMIVCADHRIAFYDKSGNPLVKKNRMQTNMKLTDLFSAFISDDSKFASININRKMNLPATCSIDEFYDARVEYNSLHKRFFILTHVRRKKDDCLARFFAIAVSKTEDPRDGFYQWVSTTRPFGDWPRIGINGNYFMYTWQGESQEGEPAAHLFSINDLKSGNPNPDVWTFTTNDFQSYGSGMIPVNVTGAASDVTYFVRVQDKSSKLIVYGFENKQNFSIKPKISFAEQESGRPFALLRCSNVSWRNGKIYIVSTIKSADRVPNISLERMSIRVLSFPVKMWVQDPVSQNKPILFQLGDAPGVRDIIFGKNNPNDDLPDDQYSYEVPALAVNRDGDIVVVYARVPVKTGPGKYPDTRYSVVFHNEAKQRPSISLKKGNFLPKCIYNLAGDNQPVNVSYNNKPGGGYIIDLACAVVDPTDDKSFWIIHCYAKDPGVTPFYHFDATDGYYKISKIAMPVIAKISLQPL